MPLSLLLLFTAQQDMDEEMFVSFIKEATLLVGFHHVNILSTLGVVWKTAERPKAVLPFMPRGDLRSLVKSDELVCSTV